MLWFKQSSRASRQTRHVFTYYLPTLRSSCHVYMNVYRNDRLNHQIECECLNDDTLIETTWSCIVKNNAEPMPLYANEPWLRPARNWMTRFARWTDGYRN
jgi:hypothetical protein